jgi:hypothetical protein
MQTASFRAVLRAGASAHLIRSLELGCSDQYYTFIHRGVGERDLINLYSREEEARLAFEDALTSYEHDSRWQKA